ncbi:MAG: hypothetical protein K2X27_12325 [Candidatus Obscuribacterales bacterium]|nr:hypothetical protein [Candidatus Obscuribacterales bacterium]
MSISGEQRSSNYVQDRSRNFRHQSGSEIGLKTAPTVEAYVQNEKMKQMNRMRDWYLEAKESQTDTVQLRTQFSSSRNFSKASPVQELDHHKSYLIWGGMIAAFIGGFMIFIH